MQQATRQAAKAPSFADAADDLRELTGVAIGATQLHRLTHRIGGEWSAERDADVARFKAGTLTRTYATSTAETSAVMLDGGRLQTRESNAGRGVTGERWRETKVACCLTLNAPANAKSSTPGADPQPEPPAKFLEPKSAARLAAEIKRRRTASTTRNEEEQLAEADAAERADRTERRRRTREKSAKPRTAKPQSEKSKSAKSQKAKRRERRERQRRRGRTRVRTVVATMESSETFGWQVAAEVHRRGLDLAKRKACVCDGQAYNWAIFAMHLAPLGFVPILDFVHLLAYLYDAAQAWRGSIVKSEAKSAWATYEEWLRWAWAGKVGSLVSSLRAAMESLAAAGASAADRLRTLEETLTYVTNNRERMRYGEYRRAGLPISSAPVESTIKQMNRRVKGTEKFWLEGGAESMLQLRAAYLSQDGRWSRNWSRPRRHRRAAGPNRLRSPA